MEIFRDTGEHKTYLWNQPNCNSEQAVIKAVRFQRSMTENERRCNEFINIQRLSFDVSQRDCYRHIDYNLSASASASASDAFRL